MPKEKSPERIAALDLYLDSNGKKSILFIAEETGATQATLRSWKKRDDWDKELEKKRGFIVTPPIEKPQKRDDKSSKRGDPVAKKQSGGQPGNRNAVGNKGGKGNPAPKGNKYAVVTGEYETIRFDTLTDTERALALSAPLDPKEILIAEYQLLVVREYRALHKIENSKRTAERGMVPASVSIESYSNGEGNQTASRRTNTSHQSLDERLTRTEDSLTGIQDAIRKVVAQLHKLHYDEVKLEIERKKVIREENERTGTEGESISIAFDYGNDGQGGK